MLDAEDELQRLGEGTGAVVRSAQIMQAMTAISSALGALWTDIGDLTAAGQQDAMTEALRQSFDWDLVLLRLGLPAKKRNAMRNSLLEAGRFNVEAMLARVYKTRLPLSEQVYKTAALAQGWVESRLDRGIARGLTVAELAREVRQHINPATPGGTSYAARRLARTEINAAYHAVTIVEAEDKPWVTGLKWRLSGSHPTRDICDIYANNDHSGLGKGVFSQGEVPGKPHPQCLCTVFPTLLPDEVFIDQLANGVFDNYIATTYGR
jgi:hypothetical protein